LTLWLVAWLALPASVGLWPAHGSAGTWTTGGLTFSDELGGARLIGASGAGTRDDPIILLEKISGAGPAVLVVRNGRAGRVNVSPAQGFLSISVVAIVANLGPWAWVGFDLELRRTPGRPSVYTDGLSFDQPQTLARGARADRFAQTLQDDEPFDRIRFDGGTVHPAEHLRLDFDIVDVNGSAAFYLVQRPIVLLAWHDRPDPLPMPWYASVPFLDVAAALLLPIGWPEPQAPRPGTRGPPAGAGPG
jgi:hypothetical protein